MIITISGPQGVGKSALTKRIADLLEADGFTVSVPVFPEPQHKKRIAEAFYPEPKAVVMFEEQR